MTSSVQTQKTTSLLLSFLILCVALLTAPLANALTAQTITGFAPATPVLFSTGGTFALTATGGGSGNPVVFASTTASICTVAGSTVTKVAVGTCNLTANQAGNATFSAATQVAKSVVISKGTQTITFAALSGKAFGIAPFTVSATASSGLAVTFTSTTTSVCTVSASTVTLVTVGTCTIAVNQAGNTNFTAATQVSQSFAIAKGAQTITFAALTGKSFGVAPFTVAATASSVLAVAFTSTTTPVCTVSGSTVTLVTVGTCTIAANQAGNTNYNAATQVTQSFTVAKGAQTITFAALSGQGFGAAPFAVSATSSSALAVVFTSTTAPICTVSGSTVTIIALGTCTIAANQAGNTNYNAATQVTQSFAVTKGAQTITFAALVGKALGAAPFAVSATSSSALAVAFTSTTAPVCTVSGSTVTLVAVGTCTIAANQAGNTNYNAATQVTQSFTVTNGAQTITFAALVGKTFGNAPFAVSATASSGLAVTFSSTTAAVCTVSGANVTIVTAGTCTIAANQAGNGSFSAAPQVTQSFTVAKSAQTITFAALAGKTMGNAPFPVSATASSGLAVVFTSTTTPVCTVSGTTVTLVSAGTCTIAANQAGNGNFSAATAVPQSFTVASAALIAQTITGFAPASPIPYAAGGNFAVSASGGASSKPVIFASTSPGVCTVSGSTVSIVAAGNCALTANQAGDATYSAAPQVTASVTITPASQTIAFATLASKLLASMPFSVSAAASSGLPVTFTSSTNAVCTVAGATITLVSVGTCTINANQSGNGSYSAAPQVSQSFNVVTGISTIYNVPLAAGDSHNCALTNSNGVKCWGLNQLGQIGDGTVVDKYTPTDVVGLASGVAAVTAGSQHSCAITIAGGVKCWGNNYYGQLGDNTTVQRNTPVDVVGLASGVVAVSAGEGHTCAITKVGGLKCWGYNGIGQLGDGSGTNQLTPIDVLGLDSGVIDVRAGGTHTCAVMATGSVKCWGNNINGQLGDGDSSGAVQYTPINVVNLSPGMLGVESGSTHSCGLTSVGGVLCWGNNVNGQLGNGNNTAQFSPVNVVGLPSVTSIIAGGYYSSCALNAVGQIQCWGGRVGSNVPVNIDDFIGGVTEVAIGSNHTCVMIAGGGIRCWGSNSSGQLGDGTTNYASSPITAIGFAGTTGISQAISFPALQNQSLGNGQAGLLATATSKLAVTFTSSTNSVCTVSASTVNFVAAGTCTIAADQSGDGNYGVAPQVIQSFTLSISPQIITGFTPATPISYVAGGYFIISASVIGGGSGNPVVFASTSPTVCSVSGGIASILTPGICTLTANQSGNASYSSAQQVTATVVIQKNPQTITINPIGDTTFGAGQFIVTATASSGLTVDFTSATPTICTTSSTNGKLIMILAVGACTLNANQIGDVNFNAAPQASATFNVLKASQTISFAPLLDHVLGDPAFTLAAAASSGLAVVFTSSTASVCSVTSNIVSIVSMGTCTIVAGQAGNGSYLAATNVTQSFTIKSTQAINGFTPPTSYVLGSATVITLTATSTAGLPVRFESASTDTCYLSGATVVFIGSGNCDLIALQDGNVTYAPAPPAHALITVLPSGQVASVPALLSAPPHVAVKTEPYTKRIVLASTSAITALTVAGLPQGINATWNGASNLDLSGTANVSGTFSVIISATNASGVATLTMPLVVMEPLVGATSISNSVGFSYNPVSCAVYAGGVVCWGTGPRGVPADPNATFVPVFAIPPGSGATAVSAGLDYVCAVVAGGLQCWGSYNYQYQGPRLKSVTPVVVYPAGSGITALTAGYAHTCVIINGGVQCFGGNLYAQLGDGNGLAPGSTSPVVAIAAGGGVTAIAAGSFHTCAVVNGGVQCWGQNSDANLGVPIIPLVTPYNTSSTPIMTLPTTALATAIGASGVKTCAVTNGGVTCWGGDINNAPYPIVTVPASSGVTATAVSCHVINGGVTCPASTTPIVYPANSGVTEITANCVAIAGKIRCTGTNNVAYELGNATSILSPFPTVAFASGSGATSVAVGAAHACAVVAGGVQCWGANASNQLGVTGLTTTASVTPVQPIPAASLATEVAAGQTQTCAIVDGGVQCWGKNSSGEVGNGTTTPVTTPFNTIPARSGVTQIAAGSNQSCAVVAGGVKCWGVLYGNSGGNPVATRPFDQILPNSGVTAIATGNTHACVVINGGIKCWGGNISGQLGNATTIDSASPVDAIPANSGATAIAAGGSHTCAIINTGVMCWGNNNYSQLGNGTTVGSLTPISILPAGSAATDLTAANFSTCAAINGGVKCWGGTIDATLGNTVSNATTTTTTIPAQTLPAGSNITAIAAGSPSGFHAGQTCAIADGGVLCWGSNSAGALGNADQYQLNTAVPAPQPSAPRAPTITFTSPDEASLLLYFSPPVYNGGSGISGYAASCSYLGSVAGTGTAVATATYIRVTGLIDGRTYACSMRAVNIVGSGQESNVWIAVPSPRYPSKPTITSTNPGSGAVVFQFTPPVSSGSGPVTSYQGYCSASGYPALSATVLGTATSVVVQNLAPNVTYSCTINATNAYGFDAGSISTAVNVTLNPGGTSVTITAPANNFATSTPAIITIAADAATGQGTAISRVDFYVDDARVGTAVNAPYTFDWPATSGPHALVAKAYDSISGITTSSVINITVTIPATAAPTIAIAAPLNSTTIALPALIPVSVNVTVAIGKTINKIELYNQPTLLWSSANTSFNWQPLTAGSYTLTAKVTDSDGNTGVSAPISVILTGAASETITYLHNDLGGNTIMASDSLGGTLWKENYTPFGDRVVKDAQATSNNRQWFAGKPQDSETGLSYFGARYYDPAVGRFMGIDAARFSEGNLHSFNRYAYGNNNPLRYRDPDGNFALAEIAIFTTLAVTAVVAISPQADQDRLAQSLAGAITGIRDKVKGIFTEQDSSSGTASGAAQSGERGKDEKSGDSATGEKQAQKPSKTPNEGEPGSTHTNPGSGQKRTYGSDGKPIKDIDTDHDHGQGVPHVHEWTRGSNGEVIRGPGRSFDPKTD